MTSKLYLLCNVGGHLDAAPVGFTAELCSHVSESISAKIVEAEHFAWMISQEAPSTLASLEVTIIGPYRLEYIFKAGCASEWFQGAVAISVASSVDLMDTTLGAGVIRHLAREIVRLFGN